MGWLSSRQGFGENEKILRIPVLAVQFDGERQAAQRTRAVDKVLAVALLQNERAGSCGPRELLVACGAARSLS
jgi:hypothetical protein